MDLDDLLADLQSALPPEQQVTCPAPTSPSGSSHKSNGQAHLDQDHFYDRTSHEGPARGSVTSTGASIVVRYAGSREEEEASFDDDQYSEVRKGPLYVPGQSTSPGLPPEPDPSPPPSKPPRESPGPRQSQPPRDSLGTSAGLSELDSLLEMLNDTQTKIDKEPSAPKSAKTSSGLDPRMTRPSVATLVDELTQVEEQVSGGADDSFEGSNKDKDGGARRPNVTASSATMELDELMQNLEDFVPPPQASPDEPAGNKKPKSAMDDLSNMLGSLESDMENIHGVSTVAKGMCFACKKSILTKVLDALGHQWHPEHFTCASCDMELSTVTYYESNGRPYCEKDYHELYAPRCAYCNGPILDRVMRALDKTWHPEHFFCTLCGKKFGPEGFHEKDGKAYCRECYYENYAPHCKRCDKAIMEGFITALNAQWHPECFSCKVCNVTFPRGNYFEHEGEPHCELHYHASRGTLCASCQKPVTGKCVTAMGRKWHPEHFTCAFCLKLLNKGTFKEHRNNPYCQPCYIKLFG